MKHHPGPITMRVNGVTVRIDRTRGTLLEVLREDLGLTGTKNGCGVGQCGSCTVLIDGAPRRACTVPAGSLEGCSLETVESLGMREPKAGSFRTTPARATLHPIQQALLAAGAVQCGFCTPGIVMTVKHLLETTPDPSETEIRRALRGNLCRCTGYQSIVQGVRRAARALRGDPAALQPPGSAPVPRLEGVPKVTGTLPYADDLSRPDMLHGVLLFSEHSHAEILEVDTSALTGGESNGDQPLPVLVLTAADLPGRNGFGLQVPHQPVFAMDRVRYPGEVIACVVAETADAARASRDRITVRYRPLPPLRDPANNMRSDAPPLHPDGNVAEHVEFTRGDPDQAFNEADLVVEGEYRVPPVEHAYLEPEACMAVPDEDGFRITVYAATQGAFAFREMIAASLDLPVEQVRVVQTMPGGGFGGKEEPTVHIQAALAALRAGRPVKITLNREESIRISTKRHAAVIRMSHAVRSDGTILGFRSRTVCDAGAYLSLTKPVVFRTVVCAAGPYAIENVHAEGFGVYTTTNPGGAFRGFGSTQVAFAAERQMDKIARRLGIDPLVLRRRNGLAAGRRTITGQLLRADGTGFSAVLETMERALAEERDPLMKAPLEPGWTRAVGIATSYKNVGLGKGLPDAAEAEVELTADGTLVVRVGATDMGQGSDTVMAQIAARAFGTDYHRVRVVSSDTAVCPDGGMTTASRQTFVTGNAVRLAAEQLAARVRDRARSGASSDGSTDTGGITGGLERDHAATAPLRERVVYTPPTTVPLASTDGPGADGDIHFAFCYTAHAVVVTVHRDSGAVRVERIIAVADAGNAIHLQNVQGQIEGGVAMGLGYALTESFVHEGDEIRTNSLAKLGVPRSDQVPPIRSEVVEIADRNGPYGAKGLGEVPLNPVAPAIANAIAAAIGVEVDTLPITPERVRSRLPPR